MKETALEIGRSIVIVLIDITLAALLMACIWTAIESMRQFGVYSQQSLADQLQAVKVAEASMRSYDPDSFLGGIESFLKWYNLTFIGAARYGSGIGIFIGAYFALSAVAEYKLSAKITASLIAGAFVGARLFLMVTSEPKMFLAGAILGALVFVAYRVFDSRQEKLPDLPIACL